MGSQKNVDMSQEEVEVKHVEEQSAQEKEEQSADKAGDKTEGKEAAGEKKSEKVQEKTQPVSLRPKHPRSKKYKAVRAKVDRTRTYDPLSAVELVKKLSYTNFEGTISAHLTLNQQGITQEVTFPHSTGRERKIEIASDKTLEKIEAGNIDFDVLLSTPEMMGKLTKYAPILGPQGLMPNPKNSTLTPNPKQRKEELKSGTIALKTERSAPLIHVPVGKTDMDTKKIVENMKVLIEAFETKLDKLTISATMSPGVKVDFEIEE